MIDMPFIESLFPLFGKISMLILIALYALFSGIIFLQIRGLNKLISFKQNALTGTIMTAFLIHLVLVISLFFLALAIL